MKIRSMIALVLACVAMFSFSVPAYAAEENCATTIQQPQGIVEEISTSCTDFTTTPQQSRGTSAPSSEWDLSSHDYTLQFDMSVAIFTNVNFKNHGGEFHVSINCSSDVDQTMYVQLYEKGSSKVAAEVIIDTDGAWNIRWYNLNTSKSYYLRFVKIDDGVSVYGLGTVYI